MNGSKLTLFQAGYVRDLVTFRCSRVCVTFLTSANVQCSDVLVSASKHSYSSTLSARRLCCLTDWVLQASRCSVCSEFSSSCFMALSCWHQYHCAMVAPRRGAQQCSANSTSTSLDRPVLCSKSYVNARKISYSIHAHVCNQTQK